MALAVFVALGTVGVGVPVAISVFMAERSTRLLGELHDWMARENATIMAVLCLVIGAKFIGDAINRARRLTAKARETHVSTCPHRVHRRRASGRRRMTGLEVRRPTALVSANEAAQTAREAMVFAYPVLLNYKTIWEQTQDHLGASFIGGFNRYRHYTRSYTAADTDIVTPNNDSPYSWAWFDVRREPVVLRVPKVGTDRYYVVQMFDLFTFNFAYVGVRATGFEAGDYLLAGPDWEGDTPDGITAVLRSETRLAGTLTRTALFGSEDMANVRAIQHGYAIQPLSEYAGLRPPPAVPDPIFPEWNERRALSSTFIGYLNFLLGFVEPHPSEAELYERLAGIGIGAGRGWRPEDVPPKILAAMEDGAKQGLADVDAQASHTTSSIGIFGSREQLGDDYLTRAVAAQMGIYGQVAEEAVYGGSRLDANGDQLVGDRTYTLRFDKDALPQAKFFWSLTLYRLPSRLLAANAIDRYSIGDRTPGIAYAGDGSLEIALQSTEPTDPVRRANWLPTPAGEPFTVIYRLYGPGEEAQAGTWSLPAITQDS